MDKKAYGHRSGDGYGCNSCLTPPADWMILDKIENGFNLDRSIGKDIIKITLQLVEVCCIMLNVGSKVLLI